MSRAAFACFFVCVAVLLSVFAPLAGAQSFGPPSGSGWDYFIDVSPSGSADMNLSAGKYDFWLCWDGGCDSIESPTVTETGVITCYGVWVGGGSGTCWARYVGPLDDPPEQCTAQVCPADALQAGWSVVLVWAVAFGVRRLLARAASY